MRPNHRATPFTLLHKSVQLFRLFHCISMRMLTGDSNTDIMTCEILNRNKNIFLFSDLKIYSIITQACSISAKIAFDSFWLVTFDDMILFKWLHTCSAVTNSSCLLFLSQSVNFIYLCRNACGTWQLSLQTSWLTWLTATWEETTRAEADGIFNGTISAALTC